MNAAGGYLAAVTGALALMFLAIALIFQAKKEKACKLLGGFNFFTEAQQARYDRARMARDYKRFFYHLAAVMGAGAVLCLWLRYWAFGLAIAVMLVMTGRVFRIDPEKAFEKYLIDNKGKDEP